MQRNDERSVKHDARGNLPLFFVIVGQVTILRDDVKTSFVPPEQSLLHSAFVPKYEVYQIDSQMVQIRMIHIHPKRRHEWWNLQLATKPALSFPTHLSASS